VTLNDFVSLKIGEPLSVTRTWTVFVEFAKETGTRQLNNPPPVMTALVRN
jgi:hypothetical protein